MGRIINFYVQSYIRLEGLGLWETLQWRFPFQNQFMSGPESKINPRELIFQRIQKEEVIKPFGTPGYIMMKNWTLHCAAHTSWRIRTKYQYYLCGIRLFLHNECKIGKKAWYSEKDKLGAFEKHQHSQIHKIAVLRQFTLSSWHLPVQS